MVWNTPESGSMLPKNRLPRRTSTVPLLTWTFPSLRGRVLVFWEAVQGHAMESSLFSLCLPGLPWNLVCSLSVCPGFDRICLRFLRNGPGLLRNLPLASSKSVEPSIESAWPFQNPLGLFRICVGLNGIDLGFLRKS